MKAIPSLTEKQLQHFWSFVDIKDVDQCWNWRDIEATTYPGFNIAGYTYKASRISYAIHYGDTDLLICHHCDNPNCVNPTHLFAGTYSDNINDCIIKGRRTRRTSRISRRSNDIARYYSYGISANKLAAIFGISRERVHRIARRAGIKCGASCRAKRASIAVTAASSLECAHKNAGISAIAIHSIERR